MDRINEGNGITFEELEELGFVKEETGYVLVGEKETSLHLNESEAYRYVDIRIDNEYKGALELDDHTWDNILVVVDQVKNGEFTGEYRGN